MVRAAELGGNRGQATVLRASKDEVLLELTLDLPALPRFPAALVVAVSRPQTIKKIIHLATTLGMMELHLLKTANVEKSYLQSKVLENDAIKAEVVLGLEQAVDSIPPAIQIHRNFHAFSTDVLPTILQDVPGQKTTRLLAHTSAETGKVFLGQGDLNQKLIVAIGPEAGWSEQEISKFQGLGFELIGLGERILRVEVAAAALLGFLTLQRSCFNKQ